MISNYTQCTMIEQKWREVKILVDVLTVGKVMAKIVFGLWFDHFYSIL